VSAVSDHEAAQRATQEARNGLGALNALVAAGDRGVLGADLRAAADEVDVCERLEAVYLARVQEEQAVAAAAAHERRLAELITDQERSKADVANDLEKVLMHYSDLLASTERCEATTRSLRSAGVSQPPAPTREQMIDGVTELTIKNSGMRSTSLYPHLALEPIARFLPAGVSA
jgi:hypothetical protein